MCFVEKTHFWRWCPIAESQHSKTELVTRPGLAWQGWIFSTPASLRRGFRCSRSSTAPEPPVATEWWGCGSNNPSQTQVWPLPQFFSLSILWKLIDLPGGQIYDPSSGKRYSLSFLPATPSSPFRTLEGLFELTRRPSRALNSPRALLPELRTDKESAKHRGPRTGHIYLPTPVDFKTLPQNNCKVNTIELSYWPHHCLLSWLVAVNKMVCHFGHQFL